MRRGVIALVAVVLCAGMASAGPVLDWLNGNRPGWLIPKPSPSPAPRPGPIQPIIIPDRMPARPGQCPGGVCPVPGQREYRALPVGPAIIETAIGCSCGPGCQCPVGKCPACPAK